MELDLNIGNILINIIGFLIAWVLLGIKSEISDIKITVRDLARNIEKIDRRVVALEIVNGVKYGNSEEG